MDKKSAIELSMNFIVVLIIAITIFGFGVRFVYTILTGSETLKKLTLEQIDDQISDLMCDSTEKICLQEDKLEVRPGKLAIVGVTIVNVETYDEFILNITKGIFTGKDNKKIEPKDYEDEIMIKPKTRRVVIKPNDAEKFGFAFEVPKDISMKGTYVFNLEVTIEGSPDLYDKIHKIYIKVI